MPESEKTTPIAVDELLTRLRIVGAECADTDLPVMVPTQLWQEERQEESTTGATETRMGLLQTQWLAQALHTEAWAPLLLLDKEPFTELAYRRFLGREPDVSGTCYLAEQLARHIPRTEILAELTLSEEALRLQPHGWRRWRWFGRLLRLALHAPLVGTWGQARLQWLVRGVLRRSERWMTRRAQTSAWALSWAQARVQDRSLLQVQQQLTKQNAVLEKQHAALEEMELHVRYLERRADQDSDALRLYLTAFEQRFRGPEEGLRAQLAQDYLPLLRAVREQVGDGPCLDLGCGRGTWLALLRDEGFTARGIDSNADPVFYARTQGVDALEGDAFAWLQTQPTDSALAVTAFHLVEHLPFTERLALTKEIRRVLRPGGILIYETPNPENMWVGAHTFYHDPTHSTPITPASLSFLTEYCGLLPQPVLRLHPGPLEDVVPGDDALTARVNKMGCCAQDYAIVAYKP